MGEGDLLSERRARRAAESGEEALTRRAEAAEATVQTLERHVASLQQRLREADEDRRRVAELIEEEQQLAAERDSELRRVKQREYAEQQLRVEAEDRLIGAEREGRLEAERLSLRLGEAELETRELNQRLESLERQLAEAEQAGGAQRAALGRAEQSLQARVAELERWAQEIQQGLHSEQAARERSEASIQAMRDGHTRMEGLLGDVKGIVGRLGAALTATRREEPTSMPMPASPPFPSSLPSAPEPPGQVERTVGVDQRGLEMADALAAAVERLRARAEGAPAPAPELLAEEPVCAAAEVPRAGSGQAPDEPPAEEIEAVTPVTSRGQSHKHSLSLIGRIRNRRKQRRGQ